MNYLRMVLQKPKTGDQIKRMIPEVTGTWGARYLLRKAAGLGNTAARTIAADIENQAGRPHIGPKQRSRIIDISREFRQKHL